MVTVPGRAQYLRLLCSAASGYVLQPPPHRNNSRTQESKVRSPSQHTGVYTMTSTSTPFQFRRISSPLETYAPWLRRLHRFNSVAFPLPWKLQQPLAKEAVARDSHARDFGIYWKRRSRMSRNCWFMYQKWTVVLRGTSVNLSEQGIRFSLKVSLQFSSPSFLVFLDSSGIPWLFVLWDSAGILL